MIKILALIALLAFVSHSTEGTQWNNWNTYAAFNYATVHSISIPTAPSGFTRYSNSSNYSARVNQYRWTYSTGGATCQVLCGPRSFLTTVDGLIICQRDQNTNFWGASSLSSYGELCIPDVDPSNSACTTGISGILSSGYCSQNGYIGSAYEGFDCCYEDHNGSNNPFDLTRRALYGTTSLTNLRNAEN